MARTTRTRNRKSQASRIPEPPSAPDAANQADAAIRQLARLIGRKIAREQFESEPGRKQKRKRIKDGNAS